MSGQWVAGPWEVAVEETDGSLPPDFIKAQGFYIASIHDGFPPGMKDANARLIAAAPRMAALLERTGCYECHEFSPDPVKEPEWFREIHETGDNWPCPREDARALLAEIAGEA